MSMSYRCSKASCRKRATFNKPITQYKRVVLCPGCHNDTLKRDAAKDREKNRNTCQCDGYAFPHRSGSKWCNYSTAALTEEDYKYQYWSMQA